MCVCVCLCVCVYVCVCLCVRLSTVHYFEFLMKAYEGKAVADVTVSKVS